MKTRIDTIKVTPGKIAIVTGANIGLGFEVTKAFIKKGIKVIMACRNLEKTKQAKIKLLNEFPEAELSIIKLDLSSLNSVREFSSTFIEEYNSLDYLVENAGIMIPPFRKTGDGFESQMGVNYFAHFLLTKLLYPTLKTTPSSRIVTLSSIAHRNGVIDFQNLNSEKNYSKIGAYAQSKLACLMFAYELDRRLKQINSDIIAVSAHPGVSPTNLFQYMPKFAHFLLKPILPLFSHKPQEAAKPIILASLEQQVSGGEFFGPKGFNEMRGEAGTVKSYPHAYDEEIAKQLWEETEKLIGEKFEVI